MKTRLPVAAGLLLLLAPALGRSAVYDIGPGQPLESIGAAPWATLAPGDTVNIHWRPAPYKEKWVICRRGAPEKPIVVHGVLGPKGERPVIDGAGATTVKSLSYTGEVRSVIKIGYARTPKDTMPSDIVLENLEVTNANPANSYQGLGGPAKYVKNAASIWIEKGERIVVRNCDIHDSGNGLFVSPLSRNITVEKCRIHGNGIVKDMFEHNVYSEATGIVFQGNRFGPLRAGSLGNNLKDRSAGLVVCDNWIEGGSRELDLVDAEDSEAIRNDPAYRTALVFQNVIVKLPTDGNKQVVHYGGDSGKPKWYRPGTLYFYNNTVISRRTDGTTLFRISLPDGHVDARNNIFYTADRGKRLAMVDSGGCVDLTADWLKTGWVNSHGKFTGTVTSGSGCIEGGTPKFVNEAAADYRLAADSPCRDAGTSALPGLSRPTDADRVNIGAPTVTF